MAADQSVIEELKGQITQDDSSNLDSDQYLDYVVELKRMEQEKQIKLSNQQLKLIAAISGGKIQSLKKTNNKKQKQDSISIDKISNLMGRS